MIGALIIQTLTYAIYSLGVPPEINLVVKAVVVFVVMLLQSAEFRAAVARLRRAGRAMSALHRRGAPMTRRRAPLALQPQVPAAGRDHLAVRR